MKELRLDIWKQSAQERQDRNNIDDDKNNDPPEPPVQHTPNGDVHEAHSDRPMVNERLWQMYGLKGGEVSRTTVWVWMRSLGMRYKRQQKTYYVDNNESLQNRIYCRAYLVRAFQRERQQFV